MVKLAQKIRATQVSRSLCRMIFATISAVIFCGTIIMLQRMARREEMFCQLADYAGSLLVGVHIFKVLSWRPVCAHRCLPFTYQLWQDTTISTFVS